MTKKVELKVVSSAAFAKVINEIVDEKLKAILYEDAEHLHLVEKKSRLPVD